MANTSLVLLLISEEPGSQPSLSLLAAIDEVSAKNEHTCTQRICGVQQEVGGERGSGKANTDGNIKATGSANLCESYLMCVNTGENLCLIDCNIVKRL